MVKKKILLGFVVAAAVAGLVGAAIVYNLGFRMRFQVESAAKIRVFLDESQTQELQQGNYLDWGPITSTDPQLKQLWIKNVGTANVTLGFGHDNQQMPQDWSLTWDYNGAPLTPGSTIQVTMTLTLPSTVGAGTYECNAGIQATPAP
jgi:hypothetical protein